MVRLGRYLAMIVLSLGPVLCLAQGPCPTATSTTYEHNSDALQQVDLHGAASLRAGRTGWRGSWRPAFFDGQLQSRSPLHEFSASRV